MTWAQRIAVAIVAALIVATVLVGHHREQADPPPPHLTRRAEAGSVAPGLVVGGATSARTAPRAAGSAIPDVRAERDVWGGYEAVTSDPYELAALRLVAQDTTAELARIVDELTPETAETALDESMAVIEAGLAAEAEILGPDRAKALERARDGQ